MENLLNLKAQVQPAWIKRTRRSICPNRCMPHSPRPIRDFMRWMLVIITCTFTISATTIAEAQMSMTTRQPWPVSQQCPTGGPEADKIFQLAVDYHKARKGMPWDLAKAEELYEEALAMGSAKAALNLGLIYRQDYYSRPHQAERLKYMMALFEYAEEMGCPEALTMQAEAYWEGWGVRKDQKKAEALIRKAAEKGSLMSITNLGSNLYDDGRHEEGKAWLEKALKLGCGNAGEFLAQIYRREKNAEKMIYYLREGAKLGSAECLLSLSLIYNMGNYGQPKDREYEKKIDKVAASFDAKEAPKPIPNFDELVPPRPVLPWKDR